MSFSQHGYQALDNEESQNSLSSPRSKKPSPPPLQQQPPTATTNTSALTTKLQYQPVASAQQYQPVAYAPQHQTVTATAPTAREKKSRADDTIPYESGLSFDDLLKRSRDEAKAMSGELKTIFQTSTLTHPNPETQAEQIVEAFNTRQKASGYAPIISTASIRPGDRLERNQFLLAHRNKVPEIARSQRGERLVVEWTGPYTDSGSMGIVNQNQPFFGGHGSYVLNVPRGQYAKAWIGSKNNPIIYNEGVHVIHDTSFKFSLADTHTGSSPTFDASQVFVNQATPYIKHGTLHILRIPQSKIAKVIVNGKPELLEPSPEPYVFDTANFQYDERNDLIDQASNYIHHQNLHIVRVPFGMYAKVIVNGKPLLLNPREEPYIFETARFVFNERTDFISQQTPYIQHGSIHVLLIPAGYIAKVWKGSTAELLESRATPYHYDDPYFRLERKSDSALYERADEPLIIHGPIKRIIPPLYQVAITNNNGKLEIISEQKRIESPTHSFVDFLSTSVQNLIFPSEKTKQHRSQSTSDPEKDYCVFISADSLKMGVKLLVAYRIKNPVEAVKLGNLQDIIEHIEGVTTADMAKTVQTCTSQEFLSSYQSKPMVERKEEVPLGHPSAPKLQTYQDIVKDKLAEDLLAYGIELIRLNIEEYKVINKDVAGKMEEQAIETAKANSKISTLRQQTQIATTEAEKDSTVAKIKAEQENSAHITRAKAEAEAKTIAAQATLDAAKINAEAAKIAATAKAEAAMIEAKAKIDIMRQEGEARNQILSAQSKLFKDNPELLPLESTKLKMDALKSLQPQLHVTSHEFASLFATGGIPFFNSPAKTSLQKNVMMSDRTTDATELSASTATTTDPFMSESQFAASAKRG